jgi:hypothetical protein
MTVNPQICICKMQEKKKEEITTEKCLEEQCLTNNF